MIKLFTILLFFIAGGVMNSQPNRTNESGVPIRQESPRPDTLNDIENETQRGVYDYLQRQDSIYNFESNLNIPPRTRLLANLQYSESEWNYLRDISSGKPWNVAMKNLEMPQSVWQPDPVDLVHHDLSKQEAFYVPFVNTYKPYGLKIPFEAIANFFGITEDTSPNINYTVEYTAEVKIVIYSVQATAIATLFNSVQQPGSYNITWNGRDDEGKRMPAGDYIAEIRIGRERYMIKKIELK